MEHDAHAAVKEVSRGGSRERSSEICRVVEAAGQAQLDEAVARDRPVVTEDPFLICRSPGIDVIVDVTGAREPFTLEVFANVIDRLTPPDS